MSLETLNFQNKSEILKSPRSKLSCVLVGIESNDLYEMSFKEYIDMSFDLKILPQDIQKLRYSHYNQRRIELLKKCIEKRKEIIENPELFEMSSSIKTKRRSDSNNSKNITSTAVMIEKEKMEKMKKRQIDELEGMINYEFQKEEIRNENLKKQKEHENKQNEIKLKKQKEHEERNEQMRLKEEKRLEKLREEEKKKIEDLKLKEKEDFQKRIDDLKRQEIQRKEAHAKRQQSEQKQKEFQEQIERMFEKQQEKLIERRNELTKKEEQIKEILKRKKEEKQRHAKKKAENSKMKFEKTLYNNENKINERKNDFEKKQKEMERRRQKYEKEKIDMFEKEKKNKIKKEENIMRILNKNEEIQKENIKKYIEKENRIIELKKLNQKLIEQEKELKEHKVSLRERHLMQTKIRYDNINEENKKKLQKRLDEINERIQKKKEEQKKIMTYKAEENEMKREDRLDNVYKNEKVDLYKRQLKLEHILMKMSNIDQLKKEKYLIAQEKRRLKDEIFNKKLELSERFDKLIKKGGKLTKEEFLNKLFGESNDFYIGKSENKNENKQGEGNYENDYDYINNKTNTEENKIIDHDDGRKCLEESHDKYEYNIETNNQKNIKPHDNLIDKMESKKKLHKTKKECEEIILNYKKDKMNNIYNEITNLNIQEKSLFSDLDKMDDDEKEKHKAHLLDVKIKNNEKINQLKEKLNDEIRSKLIKLFEENEIFNDDNDFLNKELLEIKDFDILSAKVELGISY
jgi:hypothetical protein